MLDIECAGRILYYKMNKHKTVIFIRYINQDKQNKAKVK